MSFAVKVPSASFIKISMRRSAFVRRDLHSLESLIPFSKSSRLSSSGRSPLSSLPTMSSSSASDCSKVFSILLSDELLGLFQKLEQPAYTQLFRSRLGEPG